MIGLNSKNSDSFAAWGLTPQSFSFITDTVGQTVQTASTVSLGSPLKGTINHGGDRDWYKINLTSGTKYTFDLKGLSTSDGTLNNPFQFLYDSSVNLMGTDDNGGTGTNSSLTFTPITTGDYYISALDFNSTVTGSYTLEVQSAVIDTVGQTKQTASTVSVGSPITGTIDHGGDRDWYKINLAAGTKYTFDLKGLSSSDGTLNNPYQFLYDSSINLMGTDDNGGTGTNSSLTFTPITSGDYYISALDFNSTVTGSYTLDVKAAAIDTIGQTIQTASTVNVGSPLTGSIDHAGDRDWYKINLTSGTKYTFDLKGVSSSDGSLNNPYQFLYDSSGKLIGTDDNTGTGTNSQLAYTPTKTDDYYISALDFDSTATGTYTLNVQSKTGQDSTYNLGTNSGGLVDGTSGIDTVQYLSHKLSDTTIDKHDDVTSKDGTSTDNWQVKYDYSSKDGGTSTGKSQLRGIERIKFSDTSYALDLEVDQSAGAALALLYAAFDATPDAATFGKWIAKSDTIFTSNDSKSGTSNIDTLAKSMLDTFAPNGVSNSAVVNVLYQNLIDRAPTQAELTTWGNAIESGQYTQASFFAFAAATDFNTIQYSGLRTDGLAYTAVETKAG